MEIDLHKIQAEVDRKSEEDKKRLNSDLDRMRERNQALTKSVLEGFEKFQAHLDDSHKKAMLDEIEKAKAQVEEDIRAKYAKRYGERDWNLNEADMNMKKFADHFKFEQDK